MDRHQIGKMGEEWCIKKLQEENYKIIRTNFSCRYGEIDIIAQDGQELVFIEVKTRTNESVDHAKYSITYGKQKKITKTAMFFLLSYHNSEITEYRFDVIIVKKEAEYLEINHFKNAFYPTETGQFFV
ncbi:MAG: YraN family protein [Candidatus Cloacimonetes bacterium]|jgi:putative endonuclease|nr:YraN family protein [Candidatus Cloacimonadota bacterium]MDD4156317.1 YraN family protein [Candidatus Cloacimonadota bacterium]